MKPAPPTLAKTPWSLLFQLAGRFLRGRGSHLLSGSARAALLATALGVFAMVIAMALMSGYRRDLREKIIGGSAALIVYPLFESKAESPQPAIEQLGEIAGVEEVQPVVLGQGSLASEIRPDGLEVTLRGVALDQGQLRFNSRLASAGVDYLPPPCAPSLAGGDAGAERGLAAVLLGVDLAERLAAEVGQPLRLTALGLRAGRPRFTFRTVCVLGTFETGFSEFDRNWVVLESAALSTMLGHEAVSDLYEVSLAPGTDAAAVTAVAEEVLADDYLITDSNSQNLELFAALRWQQTLLFLVLGLIVLVSMFNVASTLIVLVRERLREIGVLSAMGLRPGPLRWVFLLYAVGLTTAGTAVGLSLGALVAWTLNRFQLIRFGSDVAAIYFIDSVSFDLRWIDLTSIVAFTLITAVTACWIPASRAARIDPSHALRHE